MRDWFRNIYGDIGSLEKFLNFKILKLEFLFDNDWKHKAILGNYFVDEKADHPRLSLLFYKKYYQEENNFILTNYFKIPMRHGFNTPPVRTVEDIRWTLRDQLNGRVATKSKNKLDMLKTEPIFFYYGSITISGTRTHDKLYDTLWKQKPLLWKTKDVAAQQL